MERIKDFLYNISDIVVGFIIFVIVIFSFWYVVGGFFIDNLPTNIASRINLPVSNIAKELRLQSTTDEVADKDDDVKTKSTLIDSSNDMNTANENNIDKKISNTSNMNTDMDNENNTSSNIEDGSENESSTNNSPDNDSVTSMPNSGASTTNTTNTNTEPDVSTDANSSIQAGVKYPITITIPSGATSEDVAKMLKNAGAISNEGAFISYLVENDLDTKLIAGTYTIESDIGLESIAKKMVN